MGSNTDHTELSSDVQPWWLTLVLMGFEDDDDDSDEDESDDEDDDEDDDDSDSDEEEEEEESEDEDEDSEDEEEESKSKKKPNIRGLKSALQKERMGHKKYKRMWQQERAKNKAKSSKSDDDKDKKSKGSSENDNRSSEREQRLAHRMRDREIDTVILRYASKMNFTDPEDAVNLLNRRDIVVDQDDEDPTMIEIDEESVEDALKDLAKRKKHLLNTNGSGGRRTGSKMGGKKKKDEASEDVIRKRYGLRSL